jgi:hypothetical protein
LLEINTSKIKNTVTFTVDKQSLKEAKDSIQGIKNFAEGIQPSLNMTKIRRQMQEMERYAKRIRDAMRGAGGGNPPPGAGGGNPPPAPPPPRPPKPPKPPKVDPAVRRNDIANMKMENFSFRAAQLPKADNATLQQANRIVSQTLDLYRQEQITLQRLNQTMAHQLDNIRRSHRAKNAEIEDEVRGRRRVKREEEAIAKARIRQRERERKLREREQKREQDQRARDRARRYDRIKEGGLGLNPSMIAGAILGAGVVEGLRRIQETMSKSAERTNMISRGAQNVQTNPNAILAMQAWGRVNGVDSANIIKAIDNIKDVRERLGNSAMNSTFDQKSGKWKGGDSGINDIMNQFGWNIDQIKQFQNRPLDFIQATVNEGQRRGMNSAQIGRLMENLGDDLMHYQRMFLDNGKEYMDMVRQLTQTGGALTDEQIKAAQQYVILSEKMNQFGDGFSANMVVGFMDAMKEAPEFQKNVPLFMNAAKEIGKSAGEIAVALASLASWIVSINPENKHEKLSDNGLYYEDSAVGWLVARWNGMMNSAANLNMIPGVQDPNLMAGQAALGPNQVGFANSYASMDPYSFAANQATLGANSYRPTQSQLLVQNTLTIPKEAFQVLITPDSYGFQNMFDARMNEFSNSYTQSLTLQMSSGGSSTGG